MNKLSILTATEMMPDVPGGLEFIVVLIGHEYFLLLAFEWPIREVIHCPYFQCYDSHFFTLPALCPTAWISLKASH